MVIMSMTRVTHISDIPILTLLSLPYANTHTHTAARQPPPHYPPSPPLFPPNAQRHGGRVTSAVSGKTNFLLAGTNCGRSKHRTVGKEEEGTAIAAVGSFIACIQASAPNPTPPNPTPPHPIQPPHLPNQDSQLLPALPLLAVCSASMAILAESARATLGLCFTHRMHHISGPTLPTPLLPGAGEGHQDH